MTARIRTLLLAAAVIGGALAGISFGSAPAFACVGSCGDGDFFNYKVLPTNPHYGQHLNASGQLNDRTLTCVQFGDCNRPTGTVTVKNGSDVWGSGPLTPSAGDDTDSQWEASLGSARPAGAYALTANYSGNFDPEVLSVDVTIARAGTTTTLIQSSPTTTYGESVTFTATVADTGGVEYANGAHKPRGTVSLLSGITPVSTSPVDESTGVATFTTSSLSGGPHTFSAFYNGDTVGPDDFAVSASAGVTHTVDRGTVTNTLTQTTDTTVFGESFTLNDTLAAVAPAVGTPGGQVTFKDGAATIGAPVTLSGGTAALPVATLTVGTHSLTASYPGDSNFNGLDSNAVSHTVNKANTTVGIASPTTNPTTLGQPVTFNATVAVTSPGVGTPTGTVQFKDGTTNLGGPVALSGLNASLTTSALGGGAHSITAVYSGDGNFNGSTSTALSRTVTCDVLVTGPVGNIAASPTGTTCITNANATGGVTIPASAKVSIVNSTIGGYVTANGGAGNVIICGTTMGGLTIANAAGSVIIGDPYTAGCAGNTVTGAATLTSNHGGVRFNATQVASSVQINGTTGGPTTIGGNNISSWLQCSGNNPAPTNGGHPNTAAGRTGQCATPPSF